MRTPDQSIYALRTAFELGVKTQAELEEVRDRLQQLFDGVSDCLFVFHKGQLLLANREADLFLKGLGRDRGIEVKRSIYECGMRVLGGIPEQLYFPETELGKTLLMVQSCVPVTIDNKISYLMAVENLSQALRYSEEIKYLSQSERKRIGRDLHDGLSQLLASLSLQAKALWLKHQKQSIGNDLEEISRQAVRCVQLGAEIYHELDEI